MTLRRRPRLLQRRQRLTRLRRRAQRCVLGAKCVVSGSLRASHSQSISWSGASVLRLVRPQDAAAAAQAASEKAAADEAAAKSAAVCVWAHCVVSYSLRASHSQSITWSGGSVLMLVRTQDATAAAQAASEKAAADEDAAKSAAVCVWALNVSFPVLGPPHTFRVSHGLERLY